MKLTIEERIAAKVKPPNDNGCIEWNGCVGSGGYGQIEYNGKPCYAHRIVWELHNGPIPLGMCVLHRCDNPPCVNVDHLFLGTQNDNMKDKARKGRSSCRKGSNNHNSKLTEDQIMMIRNSWPEKSMKYLAAEYGISISEICRIIHRVIWKHVA